MTKLQNIKRIVNTFGSFTIADLEGETSPLINSMGKDNVQLAERFYDTGVDAITYVHETEVSDDFIEYENLDDDVIDEINTLAENYKENKMNKTNTIIQLEEERDTLVYENKAMAEFITYLYETNRIKEDVETVIFNYKGEK